ncbi:MAG: hypothetical protein IKK93_07185 [Campylobacter sp.]|nr:hypothetical protein [Campylobacter sp.]
MHITDSIKNNFYICDCCGAKLAPDEVAFEGKDIEGNDVHICIDCENYEQEPEMADVLEESSLKEEHYGVEQYFDCANYPNQLLQVENFIKMCEDEGHNAYLTVQSTNGNVWHTKFTLDEWKKFLKALHGLDEFGINSGVKTPKDGVAKVWAKEVNPRNSLGESIVFNKILSESDESIYNAHKEFEKDQLNKKEEDDNQENFTFDEGSVNLTTIYESVLKEGGWSHSSGYVPHDGNGMVGGKWESSSYEGEYEKDVVFNYEGKEYTVKMTLDAELDGGYDDSVNYSWADVDIDEDSIQIKEVYYWDEETKDYVDVESPDPKIIEAAKKEIINHADEYFENDWEQDEPDYPDYDPDD